MSLVIGMRVQGLDAMKVVTEDVPRITHRHIRSMAQAGAFQLENAVRRRLSGTGGNTLRVRTGNLRGSWKARQLQQRDARGRFLSGKAASWRVSSDEPYNLIHELGGPIKRGGRVVGQMPKRPFIAPAIADWEPIAQKIWADELDQAADEAQKVVDRLRAKGFDLVDNRVGG